MSKFSIIIPVYNREQEIGRAIDSCLMQSFQDFELIIIDDGSNDKSVQVVESYTDRRINLVKHEVNQGVCPARNTGIQYATGEWVLFLDSDDEYIEGALELIHNKTQSVADDIERLAFMYRWDDGRVSPQPAPAEEIMDYKGYIRWTDSVLLSDFHNCIRLRTFDFVRLPSDRAYESIYHLDFAKKFKTKMFPLVVAIEHTDATNRANNLSNKMFIQKILRDAADGARGMDELISKHGEAVLQDAPFRYEIFIRSRITFYFLAGQKWKGLRRAILFLRNNPFSFWGWSVLIMGLISKFILAWILSVKRRIQK